MGRRVLIIEDDEELSERLAGVLAKNLRCECERVGRLMMAINMLCEREYDMVVLDRNLPDGDGMDLLKKTYGTTTASQYLILSARGQTREREKGLEYGAFEYLSKPFSQIELIEKTKRLLLANGCLNDVIVKIDQMVYFVPSQRVLVVDGVRRQLCQQDSDLLYFLAQNGTVTLEQVRAGLGWDSEKTSNNAIAIRISRLRRKLGRYADRLRTHYRVGYQLQLAANAMIDTKII